jgi:Dyp-type peroxidase family
VSSNPGAELGNQGLIHFGYKDGISQPNIAGLPLRNSDDGQPQCPAGAFLLGYPSQFQNHTYDFDFPVALGRNGTFAVFRIMKQDVHGFENFLTQQAGPGGDRELVAAKICGRWRDGTPLVVSSERPENNPTNNFTFSKDPGKACPFSAHIRRTNPRDDRVAGLSGRKHRIVRAAMPYGPPYTGAEDGKERGLMGLFFCVNIADQFEFIMKNWVNRGGFQGSLSATDSDPLVGLHSFVRTRGSAYCFYPSLDGLRYIAQSA